VLIALPAVALAVLGLRAIRAERFEREQQARERQTQVTRLADAAIANAFAELEHGLRRLETRRQDRVVESVREFSNLTVFSFDRRGLLSFHRERVYVGEFGGRPAFTPSLATEQLIEQTQSAEAQGRTREAVTVYRRITSAEPKLRLWAELCIARIQHQNGDDGALARLANPDWGRAEELTPTGLPVALVACAYVEQAPNEKRARFIPLLEQTIEGLRNGRWWLSYDERRFYDAELRRLLESASSSLHSSEDARLEDLAAIEQMVRQLPPSRRDAVTRSFERGQRGAFLIIWLPSERESDVWAGVAISQQRLSDLLDAALAPLLRGQPFGAAIRDRKGNLVWGTLPNIRHTEALPTLPEWQLVFGGLTDEGWMNQRLLLWYGFILLLVLMLLVGLAMTVRVVRREAELGRLQNEFVAAVTHEFKSPITSIRLLMERLTSGRVRAPEQASEYCAAIDRETDRLELLVNRLLESRKIQTGLKQYTFAPASISEVAEAALKQLRPQAEAKGIGLEAQTEGDIPELPLDKAAITDALLNLLDNAIKYSPSDTRITVTIRLVDHQVSVDVCDQGIGIAPDDLPHIFDKFYRGRHGDQQNAHGTGLGLALVKAIVEAHGGTIEVESTPGKGSRFSLRLPMGSALRDQRSGIKKSEV
jgi:signal transduction histidine kinase